MSLGVDPALDSRTFYLLGLGQNRQLLIIYINCTTFCLRPPGRLRGLSLSSRRRDSEGRRARGAVPVHGPPLPAARVCFLLTPSRPTPVVGEVLVGGSKPGSSRTGPRPQGPGTSCGETGVHDANISPSLSVRNRQQETRDTLLDDYEHTGNQELVLS